MKKFDREQLDIKRLPGGNNRKVSLFSNCVRDIRLMKLHVSPDVQPAIKNYYSQMQIFYNSSQLDQKRGYDIYQL